MTFQPNQILDNRYELIEKLGEGGMGVVWKARHKSMGDEVVIKMPLLNDPEILKRFGKEARIMRKHALECPQILNIEDVGDLDGVPWYAMRYLPGGSLGDRTLERDSEGRAQWDDSTFDWLPKIASALDYLHDKNTYHRDVKPENILFSKNGTPYLVDFGIVKTANETTSMMTDQGKAVGTMAYMAPEILDGQKFTPQGDQYSLAVTLYETLSGDRPFSGTTFFALFKSIQKGHRRLSELYPAIPAAASTAVDRALSLEPTDRFESCQTFTNAFLTGLTSKTKPSEARTGMVSTPIKPGHAHIVGGQQVPPEKVGVVGHGATSSPLVLPGGDITEQFVKPATTGFDKKWLVGIAVSLFGLGLLGGGLLFSGVLSGSGSSDEPLVAEQNSLADSTNQPTPAVELTSEEYEESPLSLVEQHAELGFALAEVDLGHRAYVKGDSDSAVRWFRKAANQAEPAGQRMLGLMYEAGEGVEEDEKEAVRWYRKAAEQDDSVAQRFLAVMYDTGRGVEEDDKEAVRWYRKAAEQGEPLAQRNLGLMFEHGEGVEEDEAEAARWYLKAAEQGESAAQRFLGVMYDTGRGLKEDDAEAVRWYLEAAAQGEAIAQRNLGLMFEHGEGVEEDEAEAARWYRKSAEQGIRTSQRFLAKMYDSGRGVEKDEVEAIRWYREAATHGDAVSQVVIGLRYDIGQGVEMDDVEAVAWYRKAADQGNANAQRFLGLMYESGEGVEEDKAEAVRWYRKSAEQGDADAQRFLGVMYDTGQGVEEDDAEAVRWYRQAANQGEVKSQVLLGLHFENGDGVEKDQAEAVRWYRKAANQGDIVAQRFLGVMYDLGRGVPEDDAEAVRWYRKAADEGDANAQNNLGVMYRSGTGVGVDVSEAKKLFRASAMQGNEKAAANLKKLEDE